MANVHEPDTTPADPLSALRAADLRPLRDRLSDLVEKRMGLAVAVLAVVVIAARWFASDDPPIEDSLPYAAAVEVDAASSHAGSPGAVSLPAESLPVGSTEGQSPTGQSAPKPVAPRANSAETDPLLDSESVVIVHVTGAVEHPGLVEGASWWRVADAIAAAIPTQKAEPNRLNLAAPIRDGERIWVPAEGEETESGAILATTATAQGPAEVLVVELNQATVQDLDTLPGIGPSTATAIVTHRETYGPFASVDALVAVRGIGPAKLETLRPHVRVG